MNIYGHISYTMIYVYEYLYMFIKKDDEHIYGHMQFMYNYFYEYLYMFINV